LRHFVDVCGSVVVVENYHSEDDRRSDHEHDAVEVGPCNSSASPPIKLHLISEVLIFE
jgi:hypothetical protein